MKTDNKLSKRQKINLLKEGIENLEDGSCHFICTAIPGLGVNFELIPEILEYKPETTISLFGLNCWFGFGEKGIQKRIAILKKVIKDIEDA